MKASKVIKKRCSFSFQNSILTLKDNQSYIVPLVLQLQLVFWSTVTLTLAMIRPASKILRTTYAPLHDVVNTAFKNFMSDEENVRFGLLMIHKSIVAPYFGFSKYVSCNLVSCCNYFSTDTF